MSEKDKAVYFAKLKDPRWQKKRLAIFERDEFSCQQCGDGESTLHVHHLWYGDGEPWDVPDSALLTLCETCHEGEGARRDCEWSLTLALRKAGCLSGDFDRLAQAIKKLVEDNPDLSLRDYLAGSIAWHLEDRDRLLDLHEAFSKFLRESRHKKKDTE